MDRINCYFFYTLGKNISRVAALNRDSKNVDIAWAAMRAEKFLSALLRNGFNVKLKATNEAAGALFAGFEALKNLLEEEEEGGKEKSNLGRDMIFVGIRKSIEEMEHVMSAELVMAPIYSVRTLGVFSTDSLLDSADDVFGEVSDKIPDDAKADTKQAGRCLAFDLPTAAGFHVARATEAVILRAMDAFGCPKPKDSQRNWGFYINALEEKGANKTVTHHLNQLRELHRNPLIHPEVTLTGLEAQQLWSLCTSAIIAMIADMESREAAPSMNIVKMLPPPSGGV